MKYSPEGIHRLVQPMPSQALPNFISRAEDCFLLSNTGEKFFDCSMGKGAVTLGHTDEEFVEFFGDIIKEGQLYTLLPEVYDELSCKLCALSPWDYNRSVFLKNGSDAVRLSLRIARAFTGKNNILFSGYHSWQDEFLDSSWPRKGAIDPKYLKTYNFEYSVQKLQCLYEELGGDIAGVLVTPEPGLTKENCYFEIQLFCKENKIPLIMDEIKCGYHLDYFGYSSVLGLEPDMVLLSKGMANGYPLSALVGKERVVDSLNDSIFFGTYFYDALGLKLALKVLEIYQKRKVLQCLETIGDYFCTRITQACEANGVSLNLVGSVAMPILLFTSEQQKEFFYQKTLENKVLLFPEDNLGFSVSHLGENIEALTEVLCKILKHHQMPKTNDRDLRSLKKLIYHRKMIGIDQIALS